ncbi:MAG: endonuclease [Clostridia bacterium]|nr:endonuclease [Clostridia bacterium]
MKFFKKAVSVILAAVLVMSLSALAANSAFAQENSNRGNSTVIHYSGSYYDVLGGLEDLVNRDDPKTVIGDLRALINYTSSTATISNGKTIKGTDAKHPSYSGTGSSSLAAVYKKSERLANDTNSGFRLFYTNDYTTSNNWNREHVWPQSKSGGLYGKTGGGNDLHHIRPTYNDDNSVHGSFPYGDAKGGEPYYCNDNCSSYVVAYIGDDHTMEVVDEYKGDIARIYAYMVTHYGTLYNLIDKVMVGGYDTLVKWNAIDPVDDYEINRNNVAHDYQGNRNPYIDCPDLINVIWGKGTSGDIVYDTDDDNNTGTDNPSPDTDNTPTSDAEPANYITLEEAKNTRVGKEITTRGQVAYIYGDSTVILEEVDENGEVHSFQLYDQSGVLAGKYEMNSVVEVYGAVSEHQSVRQIKMPSTVKTISRNNKPIPAVECDFYNLKDNLSTVVVLRDVTLGEYDSSNITLTDEVGNKLNCFKPAEYPDGIKAGDVVNVRCVPYIYSNTVQVRVSSSSDYFIGDAIDTSTDEEAYPEEPATDSDVTTDSESDFDSDAESDIDDDTESDVDTDVDSDSQNKPTISLPGDVNCDSKVDMEDVVLTQKYIAKLVKTLSDLGMVNADVNGDGEITLEDVVMIQRMIAKIG